MGVHDSGSDIAKYIVTVERSVKFDESIKGSKFLTNNKMYPGVSSTLRHPSTTFSC